MTGCGTVSSSDPMGTPSRRGIPRACFCSPPIAYDRCDVAAQQELVAQRFARVGWETPRLLRAMRTAPDFFFDSMGQVRLDRWSRGRVALLGDAGYCATPDRSGDQPGFGRRLCAGR